jgi:hypothetical protein
MRVRHARPIGNTSANRRAKSWNAQIEPAWFNRGRHFLRADPHVEPTACTLNLARMKYAYFLRSAAHSCHSDPPYTLAVFAENGGWIMSYGECLFLIPATCGRKPT